MDENDVEYFFCNKNEEEENSKIFKFTSKLANMYDKDMEKLYNKYRNMTREFVRKNRGIHITNDFVNRMIDISFEDVFSHPIITEEKNYCNPMWFLKGIPEKGCFGIRSYLVFPNGKYADYWDDIKAILLELDQDAYYISDSKGNTYTGKEFIAFIESVWPEE